MNHLARSLVRSFAPIALPAALLASGPLFAADPVLMGLARDQANFAMGIDVRSISTSPLVQSMMQEAGKEKPELGAMMALLGPSLFEKIEEILIVGEMRPGETKPAGLVLARGDFSDDSILTMLCAQGCTNVDHAGFTLHQTTLQDQPGSFVKINDRYAALGPDEQVRELVDRRRAGSPSGFASTLEGWAHNMGGHQLWIAAKGPFEVPESAGQSPFAADALGNLDSVGLGLTLAQDFALGLEVRSTSEDEARKLYDMAQGLLMMATAGAGDDPQAAQFLQRLNLGHAGRNLTATLRVPADELRQAMASRMSQSGSGVAPAVSAGPAPEPDKPRQGVIRIHGLEDDAVEVESQPNGAGGTP